ncbi:Csu type fimbrial protein [Acinetobacter rathckeae]|uniref:Csu type fimbrial protein n=1 Tax=Acinetobacter rathckeae TaxID=2605272 RepID=UPI0018A2AAF9|nr:spore coat U domain-containing protein [Acinetobacter rathckeae]MBF7686714.1 spore coat protein U domain-containing protein [Acinetobacter rathckeae]MBF7695753.1 spore coat protein U domain-containing protein [Acinetobacter rathckeae]
MRFTCRRYLRYFLVAIGFCLALCISHTSYAVCENSGSTSGTYNYTSSNIMSDAPVAMSGTILCYSSPLGLGFFLVPTSLARICVMASFTANTSANSDKTLPIRVYGTVGGGGNTSSMTSGTWYGPTTTSRSGNTISYNVSLMVPAQTSSLLAYPVGTYTATATIYWDMQSRAGSCERNTVADYLNNPDAGSMVLTASYVVPKFCQLNTTSSVNFGTMPSVNTSNTVYDATGAVNSTCNSGTPYSIQLGLGDYYSSSLGLRRMYSTASQEYIAYDLYSDATRTRQWNTSQVVSLTGTGTAQNTIVYGRIPNIAQTAVSPGTYSDSVIVTISY